MSSSPSSAAAEALADWIVGGMPEGVDKILFLVRGLPGSGKSTLARILAPTANASNDEYFVQEDGTYRFNKEEHRDAIEACRRKTEGFMQEGRRVIAVHNTFSQPYEAEEYHILAEKHGYNVFIIEAQNKFGSVHDVPRWQQDKMRQRWMPLLPRPTYEAQASEKAPSENGQA